MTDPSSVRRRTRKWLEEIVIGMGLCPFAAKPHRADAVRISVRDAADLDKALGAVLDEAGHLLGDGEDVATSLCVFPSMFADFEDFLDGCAAVEALLEQSGADQFLQIAHFHPDYRFAEVPADDPGNYTNRAPYPIIQLLRVDDVAVAVEEHGDPDAIPERNVELLREMGLDEVRRAFADAESLP